MTRSQIPDGDDHPAEQWRTWSRGNSTIRHVGARMSAQCSTPQERRSPVSALFWPERQSGLLARKRRPQSTSRQQTGELNSAGAIVTSDVAFAPRNAEGAPNGASGAGRRPTSARGSPVASRSTETDDRLASAITGPRLLAPAYHHHMAKHIITTDQAPSSPLYSQGVRVGTTIYVAGMAGIDPRTNEMAGPSIQEQTCESIGNCQAVLEAGGAGLADVVSVTVLLANPADWSGLNEAYATAFQTNPPTRHGLPARSRPAGRARIDRNDRRDRRLRPAESGARVGGPHYRFVMRARTALPIGVAVVAACGVVVAVALGWRDPASRRALYDEFPVYPGAKEVDADAYRITDDGRPTRDRGLRVTYELPADVTAADVIGFYRAHIPAGWSEASDETCLAMLERMPPPPTISVLAGTAPPPEPLDTNGYGLIQRESRLTVFEPGEDGTPDGSIDGVGFSLSRRGDHKYVVLDAPDFACGPPQADIDATAFDR